jgi:tripartite-type tricarboxylate transporter receptor subunit TctC
VVDRMSKEIGAVLADKAIQDRMLGAGTIAHYQPAPQLAQRLKTDYDKWGQVIRDKGLSEN